MFDHSFYRDTAALSIEFHGRVFVTSDTLDQGVLYASIPKVIDHCMTETVEGFLRGGGSAYCLGADEPFGRGEAANS